MVKFIRSDLDFILQQIFIAEQNAAGMSMLDLLPNVQVPFGLRTVTGVNNNLVLEPGPVRCGQQYISRAFCRRFSRRRKPSPLVSSVPAAPPARRRRPTHKPAAWSSTSDPRTISNLIVDQTANNPAAVAAAAADPGLHDRHEPRPGRTVRHRR